MHYESKPMKTLFVFLSMTTTYTSTHDNKYNIMILFTYPLGMWDPWTAVKTTSIGSKIGSYTGMSLIQCMDHCLNSICGCKAVKWTAESKSCDIGNNTITKSVNPLSASAGFYAYNVPTWFDSSDGK